MKFTDLVKKLVLEIPHIEYGQKNVFDFEIEKYPPNEDGYWQLVSRVVKLVNGNKIKSKYGIFNMKKGELNSFFDAIHSDAMMKSILLKRFDRNSSEFINDIRTHPKNGQIGYNPRIQKP